MNGVSVVICCYNSTANLPATLAHLAKQSVRAQWEIVLVDNNSSDGTGQSAKHYWDENGVADVPFISVLEKQPGLSYAREAGVKASQYELVIFCDDDNWLEADYLDKAYSIVSGNPDIGILGGLNTAVSDVAFPTWFAEMQHAYACGPQANADGLVERQHVTGAGMVIRKELLSTLKAIGFKSLLTDRKGKELSSGGDSEICFAALMLHFKVVYFPELKLQHYIDERRLNWRYFIKMLLGHARASYTLQYYQYEVNNTQYSPSWLGELLRITRLMLHTSPLRLSYDYVRCRSSISSPSEVGNLMDFEKWLIHLKKPFSYSGMVQTIKRLKIAVADYARA